MTNLDKFYTKKDIAKKCYNFLIKHYPNLNKETFLEPSAGAGSFLDFLPRYEAYDIAPEGEHII